ncbi:MAG: MmcQ/YjbR family DNA-binding protein [Anaerolineales bacterium]|nr:MmcQ/YjbR family DNA-binding protein [Anaerolineales bacterium]
MAQDWRKVLSSKPGAEASYPFGPGALVFKVAGKMFALLGEDEAIESINLKCDPQDALALRAAHPAITPGYHMNKKHWNTLLLDGSLPDELVLELIDQSYDLVAAKLPKAVRKELGLDAAD